MTAPLRLPIPSLRVAVSVFVALLLAACAGQPPKPAPSNPSSDRKPAPAKGARKPWTPLGPYTPGGLYAPGVADGAPDVPPDIAKLPEPVPHPEPLSRYGNRSPYAVLGKNYTILPSAAGYLERGMASWYGTKFDGRVTSSFEPYDLTQFTAAHRTLPLPSYARVTNLENGRSVIVRINDRGPFHEGRLIDLSYAAAIKLGVNVHGTAMVEVRGIDTGQPLPASNADNIAAKPAAPRPVAAKPKPAAASKPLPIPGVATPSVAATGLDDDDDAPSDAAKPTAGVGETSAPVKDDVVDAADAPASNASVATTERISAPPAPASVVALPPPPAPSPTNPPASIPAPPAAAPAPASPDSSSASAPLPAPVSSQTAAPPAIATSVPAGVPTPAAIAPPPSAGPLIGRPAIDPTTRGFLQIASYGDRTHAERMLQRLQQAGVEHAELVSVQVANQTLWRVHVGPMRADEAEQIAAHLDALGFGTPPFFKE
jgi:rare lipoprotein A